MKTTKVEALYLRMPEIGACTDSSQDALLIRITTDAGIVGWGEDRIGVLMSALYRTVTGHR